MKLCPDCKRKYEQIYGKLRIKDGVIHLLKVCDDEEPEDDVK